MACSSSWLHQGFCSLSLQFFQYCMIFCAQFCVLAQSSVWHFSWWQQWPQWLRVSHSSTPLFRGRASSFMVAPAKRKRRFCLFVFRGTTLPLKQHNTHTHTHIYFLNLIGLKWLMNQYCGQGTAWSQWLATPGDEIGVSPTKTENGEDQFPKRIWELSGRRRGKWMLQKQLIRRLFKEGPSGGPSQDGGIHSFSSFLYYVSSTSWVK